MIKKRERRENEYTYIRENMYIDNVYLLFPPLLFLINNTYNFQGKIIALEKNAGKVKRFKEKCNDKNIKIFCHDATKAVVEQDNSFVHTDDEPPFKQNHFDRILLDTPCSALGQRPQLYNTITSAQLRSYIPLQRGLFSVVSQFELVVMQTHISRHALI